MRILVLFISDWSRELKWGVFRGNKLWQLDDLVEEDLESSPGLLAAGEDVAGGELEAELLEKSGKLCWGKCIKIRQCCFFLQPRPWARWGRRTWLQGSRSSSRWRRRKRGLENIFENSKFSLTNYLCEIGLLTHRAGQTACRCRYPLWIRSRCPRSTGWWHRRGGCRPQTGNNCISHNMHSFLIIWI